MPAGVEQPDLVECGPSDDEGCEDERLPCGGQRAPIVRRRYRHPLTAIGAPDKSLREQAICSMRRKEGVCATKASRFIEVIGVQEGDPSSSGLSNANVPSACGAAVALASNETDRTLRQIPGKDGVRRAVVND